LDSKLIGEQAVVDVAFAVGFLTHNDRDWLLHVLVGDNHRKQHREYPEWNHDRGELKFRGEVIRRVRIDVGSQIVKILDEFERQGWSERIDSPITDSCDDMAHRDAIRVLNQRLAVIRFRSDGSGRGILWGIRSPSTESSTHRP
jgi:hypothetical protein